jgi:glycerol-3-phosphate dehydrogenase
MLESDGLRGAYSYWDGQMDDCRLGLWAADQASRYRLDLVRGSHVELKGSIDCGCVLQVPGGRRILCVLPWQGNILLGTTEVRQAGPDHPMPEQGEINYLLATYNSFFTDRRSEADITLQ